MITELNELLERAKYNLQMSRWKLDVSVHDAPADDKGNEACVHVDSRYKNASFVIRRDLDAETYRHALAHEIIHCLLERTADYTMRVIARLPDEIRPVVEEEFLDKFEENVDDLAFIFRDFMFKELPNDNVR